MSFKICIAGSVTSTAITLKKIVEHKLDLVGVFGLENVDTTNISGYVNLKEYIKNPEIKYVPFKSINENNVVQNLKEIQPDILFVVGLSQLISEELMGIPKIATVGFHPTNLPLGRGRAPMAWLILNEKKGAACFFKISAGIDDGPIFIKEEYDVEEDDDVASLSVKLENAINCALDKWLPELRKGKIHFEEQDHSQATYYGRRAPNDGLINWYDPAKTIDRLIRATTQPYPGAFTYYGDFKIIIWKSEVVRNNTIKGVIGRVLEKTDPGFLLVQTGENLLLIKEYEVLDYSYNKINDPVLKVGCRLGYYEQNEIFNLRNEIKEIKKRLK